LLGTGLLLLAAAPAVVAGPINYWSYSATVGPAGAMPPPGSSSYAEFGGTVQNFSETDLWVIQHSSAYNLPGPLFQGKQTAWVGNVNAVSETPDEGTNAQGYTYALSLTDSTSGKSGAMTFSGSLSVNTTYNYEPSPFGSGTWPVPASSQLVNTFSGPATQSLVLGANRYTVAFSFVPGANNGQWPSGTFQADVHVSANAEPGTLVLAGLGLAAMGLATWRCGRRGAAAHRTAVASISARAAVG
jgi:hypothetical protein